MTSSDAPEPRPPTMIDLLLRYLQRERENLLGALDGLSDYDVRRPMTPTGTSLLGLVKHVGDRRARLLRRVRRAPLARADPVGQRARPSRRGEDMYALADESREMLLDLYRRVVGVLRPEHPRARARRPGRRAVVAARTAAPRRSATSWCTCSPRPPTTPATPTSCASRSTGAAGATTTTSATRSTGRRSSRRSRPPPMPTDVRTLLRWLQREREHLVGDSRRPQ